jgi:two-component system, LytTR family, response regulator
MLIKTLLLDDEPDALELLARDLSRYCPDVVIVGQCTSGAEARTTIRDLRPDLIFSDIEMPGINGVALLQALKDEGFDIPVIFVTAHRHYAADAFGVQALDFLLKPVEGSKLVQAVQKYTDYNVAHHLTALEQRLDAPPRLRIANPAGFEIFDLARIAWCEADGSITKFYLTDGRKVTSSRNLGYYDEHLSAHGFCRIHHKYLIQMSLVAHYSHPDRSVTLSTGAVLPVAHQRLKDFLEWIERGSV